jgi:hypothetical protein
VREETYFMFYFISWKLRGEIVTPHGQSSNIHNKYYMLVPFAPAGIPVLAASVGALLGLSQRARAEAEQARAEAEEARS